MPKYRVSFDVETQGPYEQDMDEITFWYISPEGHSEVSWIPGWAVFEEIAPPFVPGWYQIKNGLDKNTCDVRWFEEQPGKVWQRMNVTVAKEDSL